MPKYSPPIPSSWATRTQNERLINCKRSDMLSVSECPAHSCYRNQKDMLLAWPDRRLFGEYISSHLISVVWPWFLHGQSNIFIPALDMVVIHPIAHLTLLLVNRNDSVQGPVFLYFRGSEAPPQLRRKVLFGISQLW